MSEWTRSSAAVGRSVHVYVNYSKVDWISLSHSCGRAMTVNFFLFFFFFFFCRERKSRTEVSGAVGKRRRAAKKKRRIERKENVQQQEREEEEVPVGRQPDSFFKYLRTSST